MKDEESGIDFLFIGWVKEIKNGVDSDKVWTAFETNGTYYAGWGARGKKISFKKHTSKYSLEDVMRKKKKDYAEVDAFQLFTIFPYFTDDVSKYLMIDLLMNKVK